MVDVSQPGSPGWWLARLGKKLDDRRAHYELLDRYRCGEHPLPEGDDRCRDMFRRFQRKARTNYCGLVVESMRERLAVTGFRMGNQDTAAGSEESDAEANRIWQANYLDADASMVHIDALTYGRSYVIVGPNPDDDATPLITPEDPCEVISESDPVNRRLVRAALKTWHDDVDGNRHAVLYLPETIYYYEARRQRARFGRFDANAWQPEQDPATNPWGVVPVVPFVNRPDQRREGFGEFEDVVDIQDRINNTTLDRMVITKLQAYRQRWVKGIPTEDEDGNPLDLPFVPGVDLLWAVEDENVEFGEFQQVNLSPLLDAVRDDVKAFVTITGLPPHYVQGDLVNASADALAAAEARLVAKARERARQFGESWEAVMRLAFRIIGDTERAAAVDAETLWADPERKTDAQLADAAVKKMQAGVPWAQRMRDMQYTPAEITRMRAERADEALQAMLTAPPPPPPGQQPPPPGQPPAPGQPAQQNGQQPAVTGGGG